MSTNGSNWAKWDLHVHTPASLRQNYGGVSDGAWNHFLTDLENLDSTFKVIGINDYIFLDGYKRILEEKNQGRLKNIELFLPVIELRISKFGGTEGPWSRVNLHVIFDPALSPEQIEAYFLTALKKHYTLTPEAALTRTQWNSIPTRDSLTELGQKIIDSTPAEKRAALGPPLLLGFHNLNVDMASVEEALNEDHLRGKYLLAVGKTEWAEIKWSEASIAEKKHTINQANFVFTASADPSAAIKSRESLRAQNVNARLLDCSDAHSFANSADKDRIGNCWTWIKADCDFRGLKFAALEYDARVYIGDAPPIFARMASQPNRFIESIEIHAVETCPAMKRWFDVEISINPGMCCIVGNKGSGKSALTDTIGMLGNAHCEEHFSFLHLDRFRKPPAKLGKHFNAILKWRSGRISSLDLMAPSRPGEREEVRYLPQHYLEAICNEVPAGDESLFERELKRIIFYNLPESRRAGRESLDYLIKDLGESTDIELKAQRHVLQDINAQIADSELLVLPKTRDRYQARLNALNKELVAHEATKPAEVAKPGTAAPEIQALRTQMETAQAELTELTSEKANKEQRASKASDELVSMRRAHVRIADARKQFDAFRLALIEDLAGLFDKARVESWLKFEVMEADLDRAITGLETELQGLRALIDDKTDSGVTKRIAKGQATVVELKNKLSEPERLYLAYTDKLKQWENSRARLVGSAEAADSIEGIKRQLQLIEGAKGELDTLYAKRRNAVGDLFDILDKSRAGLGELYEAAKSRLEGYKDQKLDIPIVFEVKMIDSGFSGNFLKMIHKGVKSAFLGAESADSLVSHLLQEMDCTSKESVVSFVEEVFRNCREFKGGDGTVEQLDVRDILVSGVTVNQLCDYVTSLSYLRASFRLRFQDKDIRELSPGQRGMVLLLFYLLVDSDDVPLIVDQPEENLDNETVVSHLVNAFRVARERRQVIVVTHNANLAVVCDADQIIHAHRPKHDGPFLYDAGSLETSEICKHVVDVLEGTEPAFKMRATKYIQ